MIPKHVENLPSKFDRIRSLPTVVFPGLAVKKVLIDRKYKSSKEINTILCWSQGVLDSSKGTV